MTTITQIAFASVLATSMIAQAQQTPQPPAATTVLTATGAASSAAATPASVTACTKQPTQPPPHKPSWFEKKAKALACKQNKNMCDLPSSVDEATGETPQPKPCAVSTAPGPPPAKLSSVEANTVRSSSTGKLVTATGQPSGNRPPVYVCPPKSVLIPNFPYCVYPDHSVVDAMPLPPVAQQANTSSSPNSK